MKTDIIVRHENTISFQSHFHIVKYFDLVSIYLILISVEDQQIFSSLFQFVIYIYIYISEKC